MTEDPFPEHPGCTSLVTPENSGVLDREASASWGLDPFALVEAAGRSCASTALEKVLCVNCARGPLLVCAGSGNNGADALVMLRALLMNEQSRGKNSGAAALLSRFPTADEKSPRSQAVKALQAMGVPVIAWNGTEKAVELFRAAALVIDGIAGTGLQGPLDGIPLEMAAAVNNANHCRVISIDVPSGAGTGWKPGCPVVRADYTLAIEPLKTILYTPAIRSFCGTIIPVKGIFPPQLLKQYGDAGLLCWEEQRKAVPPAPADSYKYRRGVVEIHAGKTGSAGAARLAAAGASAAGAGIIRLVVDDQLYPVLAPSLGGIMAVPFSLWSAETTENKNAGSRFKPDVLLLGPGWGRGEERKTTLRQAMEAEQTGTPLILDADAIALLTTLHGTDGPLPVFHGRTILTPHAGELEALSGIPKEQLLCDPSCIAELAKKMNAVILFKSHVMIVASPGGKIGFIDGMDPSLGAGGSGDLLAGLSAGIAGRMKAQEAIGLGTFDPYDAAAAAGTLLVAGSAGMGRSFYDPLELVKPAAELAGKAWLP